MSDLILEESGVLGDVSIHEYELMFIPLAEDLLSLELENAFADLYLVSIAAAQLVFYLTRFLSTKIPLASS